MSEEAPAPQRGRVEQLAEALVLADPSDATGIASLADEFALLAAHAGENGERSVKSLADEASRLLTGLLVGRTPADEAFSRVGAIITELQLGVTRCGAAMQELLLGDAPVRERRLSTPSDAVDAAVLDAANNPLAEDAELVADFVARSSEHMQAAEAHLLALEATPGDADELNSLFRCFHTVKGMAGFLSLDRIATVTHAAEDLLEEVRTTRAALDAPAVEELFGSIDEIRDLVAAVETRAPSPEADDAAGTADTPGLSAPNRTDAARLASDDGRETVRVDAGRLDQLLDAIGELVIAESMVSAANTRAADPDELRRKVERLDRITRDVQEMSTSLRMVSLKTTFMKMARVARDASRKSGKTVDFVTVGEDTELDKAVVDAILDPLIHIVRNAIGHGIEDAPETRTAAGKPEVGRVELRAFHRGGSVFIEVEDDGAGIDLVRIREIAIERGMLNADETVADDDLVPMLFEPGFSTAASITGISGRGVGMDVVKRAVESLRGLLDVRSEPGRGSVISMRLPLTLAIIDGIVLRVGAERFIVPTLSVVRSVRLEPGDVTEVPGAGELLRVPDGVIRLVRLARLFDVAEPDGAGTHAIAVIVEDESGQVAFIVDELLDRQNVVIKSLTGPAGGSRGLAGAAIMPDGQAGLILDVSGLVRMTGDTRTLSAGTAA